jgi:hypothetical protein
MNQSPSLTQQMNLELLLNPPGEFIRVPGLLRRWELEQVVTSGAKYWIEDAGELSDKTQVFAVYRRELAQSPTDLEQGVPVGLSFEDERLNVRARLLPISSGDLSTALLVVGENPEDAAAVERIREYLTRSVAEAGHISDDRGTDTAVAQHGGIR